MEGLRNVLKASELHKIAKEWVYQESLHGKCEGSRSDLESLEKEWKKFRNIVNECTNDACCMRHLGWQEIEVNVGVKNLVCWWPKKAFEEWQQRRNRLMD